MMRARAHRRARVAARGLTAVEGAVLFAIVGSVAAVAVPAFVREVRASRFVEPVEGLQRIGEGALAYAAARAPGPPESAFPPSAPLTPPAVPRGTREVDPPGSWEHPTWKALGFRAAPDGVPHAFSFAFDNTGLTPQAGAPGPSQVRGAFVAHAHGDLDGDGVRSTFEIHGRAPGDQGVPASIEPGMVVLSEVE